MEAAGAVAGSGFGAKAAEAVGQGGGAKAAEAGGQGRAKPVEAFAQGGWAKAAEAGGQGRAKPVEAFAQGGWAKAAEGGQGRAKPVEAVRQGGWARAVEAFAFAQGGRDKAAEAFWQGGAMGTPKKAATSALVAGENRIVGSSGSLLFFFKMPLGRAASTSPSGWMVFTSCDANFTPLPLLSLPGGPRDLLAVAAGICTGSTKGT